MPFCANHGCHSRQRRLGEAHAEYWKNYKSRIPIPRPLLEQPWILHREVGQVVLTTQGLPTNLDPIKEHLGLEVHGQRKGNQDIHSARLI
jgi:hypothetical protein